jgi:hypothetical protein
MMLRPSAPLTWTDIGFKKLLPSAVGATLLVAVVLNLCDWIFRCGCHSWWTGAAAHCNIHMAHHRHCPWCTLPGNTFWMILGLIAAAQVWGGIKAAGPTTQSLLASLVIGFTLTMFFGLAAGMFSGYWR